MSGEVEQVTYEKQVAIRFTYEEQELEETRIVPDETRVFAWKTFDVYNRNSNGRV